MMMITNRACISYFDGGLCGEYGDGVYYMLFAGIFYFVMFFEYMEKSRIMI